MAYETTGEREARESKDARAKARDERASEAKAEEKDDRTPEEKKLAHMREQIGEAEAKVNQMKSELAAAEAEVAVKVDAELTEDQRNERVREQAKIAAQALRTGTRVDVA